MTDLFFGDPGQCAIQRRLLKRCKAASIEHFDFGESFAPWRIKVDEDRGWIFATTGEGRTDDEAGKFSILCEERLRRIWDLAAKTCSRVPRWWRYVVYKTDRRKRREEDAGGIAIESSDDGARAETSLVAGADLSSTSKDERRLYRGIPERKVPRGNILEHTVRDPRVGRLVFRQALQDRSRV